MPSTVDARGLSCPQPVLMTLEEIKRTPASEIMVLVDAEVSKENVSRAAQNQGWTVQEIKEESGVYTIFLIKR